MRRLLTRINHFFRRLACRIFGHVRRNASMRTVGITLCRRCLRITEQKTVRTRVTRGEIEKRMATFPPSGYQFVSANWKSRTAKFVSPTGTLKFVSF